MSTSINVFILGITGYVGGNVAARMIEKHPDWDVVALVRTSAQKDVVLSKWPKIRAVIGDLDNRDLLIQESSKADVILQLASSDHVKGALAVVEGASLKKPEPGHVIHISGTGMLHEVPNGFGQPSDKVYHDIVDLAEVTSLPEEGHIHRGADKAVLEAHKQFSVPTAIICPPLIHGISKGPIRVNSIQIPMLTAAIVKRERGFQVEKGENFWDAIHVDDVSDAIILLAEEGLKPRGGNAQWGDEGYYFAEAEEFQWGSIAVAVTKALYEEGALKSGNVDSISIEDATQQHPYASILWGGNCRSRADRLHALGWEAKAPNVLQSVPEMVAESLKSM
ncbi:hypothetical protein HYFRA_00010910 [Hymenoscyphus fraxineus]|uniref:NAD(P)-binding domain-containing protein n=1 Tax=Hymenoscyphus fraxineus TaxID=746836 RepID=A0A9N9KUY3_9HELO|nr:hypothetical protein HYFRA_00010910 [Hymenoscyphus fraxineus]